MANRITPKRSIGHSTYILVCGKEERLPISLELTDLDMVNRLDMIEEQPMKTRLVQLVELEELRNKALKKIKLHKEQVKRSFEKRETPR